MRGKQQRGIDISERRGQMEGKLRVIERRTGEQEGEAEVENGDEVRMERVS